MNVNMCIYVYAYNNNFKKVMNLKESIEDTFDKLEKRNEEMM